MDKTKIEQVEAQTEEVQVAEEAVENAEAVETPVEEVQPEVQAAEEPTEEIVAEPEEVVAEGCDCGKCENCQTKKEPEDDETEKKVKIKEGLQAKHDAKQRKEVAQEQSKDLLEALIDRASVIVAEKTIEAMDKLPIEEGMSEEDVNAKKELMESDAQKLLADVVGILEELVAGTTVELNGAQVEVKDFVGTGGKVGMGLPAGINPPCKSEDDESEKKVTIKAYHESVEDDEIDYKAKYAESEALMDELVDMVEKTSSKYTDLVENYNKVLTELRAYQISEKYGVTVDDAMELLEEFPYEPLIEEFEAQANGEEIIAESEESVTESEEQKEEDVTPEEEGDPAEGEKKKKEEEEKAEDETPAEEKSEAVEETPEIEGVVVSESEEAHKVKAFSVFSSNPITESKKSRKAYSVFAD